MGLCALLSATRACTLCCGVGMHSFQLPGWPLHRRASVNLFRLTMPTFCVVGFMCICCASLPTLFVAEVILLSAVLEGLCVLPKFVCLPSISTPDLPFVLAVFVWQVTFGYLGLPSELHAI